PIHRVLFRQRRRLGTPPLFLRAQAGDFPVLFPTLQLGSTPATAFGELALGSVQSLELPIERLKRLLDRRRSTASCNVFAPHRRRQLFAHPRCAGSGWGPRSGRPDRAPPRAVPEPRRPADRESEAPAHSRSRPVPKAGRARPPLRQLGAPPARVERHLLPFVR